MTVKSVGELKSEIAGYYLEELKQELGWLKSLTLLPIKNKVKDIIAGKGELSDKFDEIKEFGGWKNIINFIAPSTAEKIFKFMKEKREELVKRTTKEELIQFKNEIVSHLNKSKVGNSNINESTSQSNGNYSSINNGNSTSANDGNHTSVNNGNHTNGGISQQRLNGSDMYGDIPQSNMDIKYIQGRNLTSKHLDVMGRKMKQRFPNTPLNANMIKIACENNPLVPAEYLLAFMQNDSGLGTAGKGAKTRNPGNVGNDDNGRTVTFNSRQEGVNACARNLQRRIDSYFSESAKYSGVGFNKFPTPEELATGKSKGGKKFFGIYMSDPNGPSRVASIAKDRNKDLMA